MIETSGGAAAVRCAVVCAALLAAPARAADEFGHPWALPLSTQFGVESITLPGNEHLGMASLSLLFEPAPGWWFGPSVHGAARGERGGLFVAGVEARRRWTFGATRLAAGLFAGGGGGAAAPVGDGLMLRPSLTLTRSFGAFEAGLSWSYVNFPGGDISSQQFGLVLGWDGQFRYADPARAGQPSRDDGRSGLGVDSVHATFGELRLRDSGTGERDVGLVGVRLERMLGTGGAFGTVEGSAAASGDAAGYMEILAGAGWRADLPGGWALGARAAAGLGGGGAVSTGGGLVGRVALDVSKEVVRGWRAGLELAAVDSHDGSMRGTAWQGWIAADIDAAAPHYGGQGKVARHEWVVTLQHSADVERKDGRSQSLQTLGFKFNRYVDPMVYLSAQAHTAVGGDAGAYGTGLLGAGLRWSLPGAAETGSWQAGIEALVGAAGGGGVDTAGGAIAQALAWAALAGGDSGQLRVGLGLTRSLHGGMSTPLVELAWVRAFGHGGP